MFTFASIYLFRDRICDVFSTSERLDGSLSFEDFLDMMSAFSDDAPKNLKAEYAFKVYGEFNWKLVHPDRFS